MERYEFNLIDLDDRLLRREVKSKVMYLTIKTDDNQKMIKYFKNGDQENYQNSFSIAVDGVDDYRQLESKFESAIKKAQLGQKNDLSGLSFEQQLEFLKENVGEVRINDGGYDQEIKSKEKEYLLQLNVDDETQKNTKLSEVHLNLADLQENSIRINVSGKKLFVKVSTKNNVKWIENYEESEFQNFSDDFEILVTSTNQARNISSVLKVLIPEAENLEKAAMEELYGIDMNATFRLNQFIKDFKTDKKELEQSIEGDCISKYLVSEIDSKDNSSTSEYKFNYIDLEADQTEIKTSSSSGVRVEIKSDVRLISHSRNEELQNYSREIEIPVKNVEAAKSLIFLLKDQIKQCKSNAKEKSPLSANADTLLMNSEALISDVSLSSHVYKQTLTAVDNVPCKLQLIQTKSDKNKDTETTYEFNLSDLNPSSVDFAVSGRELSLELFARNKEKVIKRYQANDKSDYVDRLKIYMDDVENARQLIELFKALINACEE